MTSLTATQQERLASLVRCGVLRRVPESNAERTYQSLWKKGLVVETYRYGGIYWKATPAAFEMFPGERAAYLEWIRGRGIADETL